MSLWSAVPPLPERTGSKYKECIYENVVDKEKEEKKPITADSNQQSIWCDQKKRKKMKQKNQERWAGNKKEEECENKVMNCLQKRAVKEENEKGRSEMARSIYEEKIMQEKYEYI